MYKKTPFFKKLDHTAEINDNVLICAAETRFFSLASSPASVSLLSKFQSPDLSVLTVTYAVLPGTFMLSLSSPLHNSTFTLISSSVLF